MNQSSPLFQRQSSSTFPTSEVDSGSARLSPQVAFGEEPMSPRTLLQHPGIAPLTVPYNNGESHGESTEGKRMTVIRQDTSEISRIADGIKCAQCFMAASGINNFVPRRTVYHKDEDKIYTHMPAPDSNHARES
jgi:hypothetical protein